jgi:hypothetical protein
VPLLGAAAVALMAACVALAWANDSPIPAQAGGATAGDPALAWAFLAAAAGALLVYVVAMLTLNRRSETVALVAAFGVGIQLVPLGAPLLLSTDAWAYWDHGRMPSAHAGNPYRNVPADFPSDPAFPWVGADWRESSSVYGPAFTLASEPVARAAGASHEAAAWLYKVIGAAAVLAAAVLAAAISSRPALAFGVVAWNPLLAIHFAGGGHNDAWMAALVAGALVLSARSRDGTAGAAWSTALFVKWMPLALLPLHVVAAWSDRRRVTRLLAGVAIAAVIVGVIATWRYGTSWVDAAAPLVRNAGRETEYALPHRLTQLGLPRWLALGLAGVALVIAYAWLLRGATRGRARLALAAGALLLATPYLAPWYLVWLAPLAAAEDDRPAIWLTLALSAYLLPQTIPL